MKPEHIIGTILRERGMTIAIAESCTGGLISHRITNIPGSSDYFERGYIVYSNQAKTDLLQVPEKTINKFGAVSKETASEMANGVRKVAKADLGLAVTGIAGPGGGTTEKPVGLVCIALASSTGIICEGCMFSGKREEIKQMTSDNAFEMVLHYLKEDLHHSNIL